MAADTVTLSNKWPRITMLGGRKRRLDERLSYAGPDPIIVVPAGFECDLASVPRVLWWWASPDGKYRAAAVIHDFLYRTQECSRRAADAVFYHAMRAAGVRRTQALAMWAGVRLGGWVAWRRNKQS